MKNPHSLFLDWFREGFDSDRSLEIDRFRSALEVAVLTGEMTGVEASDAINKFFEQLNKRYKNMTTKINKAQLPEISGTEKPTSIVESRLQDLADNVNHLHGVISEVVHRLRPVSVAIPIREEEDPQSAAPVCPVVEAVEVEIRGVNNAISRLNAIIDSLQI